MSDCIDRELREVLVPFLNKLLYKGRDSITVADMKRLDALQTPPDARELAPRDTGTVAAPDGQHGVKACQPISGASGPARAADGGFPEPMADLMDALRAVWPGLPDERLRRSIEINLSTDAMPILHELARTRRRVVELEALCAANQHAADLKRFYEAVDLLKKYLAT